MTADAYFIAGRMVMVCWAVFIICWLISAPFTKRTVHKLKGGVLATYRVSAILGWVLLIEARRFPYPLSLSLIPRNYGVAWVAAGLSVAGLCLCLWARVTLGRNWSADVTLKESHELIQQGPYGFVRHPIYTGMLTMFIGTVLLSGFVGGVLGVLVLFGSFWVKLKWEEKLMLQQFPNDYPAYMQRVKRLIPFLG